MTETLESVLAEVGDRIASADHLVRAVLSGRRRNMQPRFERIDLRPVSVQGERKLQWVEFDGRTTVTRNEAFGHTPLATVLAAGYGNFLVETTTETLTVRIGKRGQPLVHRQRCDRTQTLEHDRAKARLLDPADPFLIEVGISDAQGRVKPSRQDKYRQVEEFLRLLVPSLEAAIAAGHIAAPNQQAPLRLVDLGCGHAYLTFAAHQYLRGRGIPVEVVGVDVRKASRDRNTEIAARLGISASIHFLAEEISATHLAGAHVAIALHACDTATDDALAWAVRREVGLILAAPCCHHDLQRQLSGGPEPWGLVTRYGLLKERFVDVLTDALRCHLLKLMGYRVEAIEFVGGEHTPRNLMIRAVRTKASPEPEDVARYRDMVAQWEVQPALEVNLGELIPSVLRRR